jgi:hypothetical protein
MGQSVTIEPAAQCPYHGTTRMLVNDIECNEWGEPSVKVVRCMFCSYEVRVPYVRGTHLSVDACVETKQKP